MWVAIFSSFSILIPFFIGIKQYNTLPHPLRIFWYFIVFSTLFEGVVFYAFLKHWNNLWMFKVFLVCDLLFFSWYFNRYLPFPKWKIIFTIVIFAVLLVSELYIRISHRQNLNSIFYFTVFLFFIIQSGYIIIVTFENFEISILNNYAFWIAFARLFYFLSILFIYTYANITKDMYNNEFFKVANNTTNSVANIILNTLYGVSFICQRVKS